MKRISSIFASSLALVLLSAAALTADVAAESKRANEFFDKCWDENLARHPVDESFYGIKTHYDQLEDLSDEKAAVDLKILELREKAKKELGNKFDIRQFHEVVLTNGAIPLDVLQELVDRWVKSKQGG
jgi:uncharacterized protein (DUF885 family)